MGSANEIGHQDFDDDPYQVDIRDTGSARAGATAVGESDLKALASVQSRCEPVRMSGADWQKSVVWIQVDDDGEYAYTHDFSCATPVSEQALSRRIDQLIAKDVALLRRRREEPW